LQPNTPFKKREQPQAGDVTLLVTYQGKKKKKRTDNKDAIVQSIY